MKTANAGPVAGEPSNGLPQTLERLCPWMQDPVLRRLQPKGIPHLFGNENLEMGESTIHLITAGILLYGLGFHFALQKAFRVFGNLNLYYSDDPREFVSPDVMVVRSSPMLPEQLQSYTIGEDGPAPVLVGEVLSVRTWQESDLSRKPITYSALGVDEYIITDVTGEMLQQRLLLLRRQRDGHWQDEQDADGGITSRLGFRIVIAADGQLRLIDTITGKHYARPDEAQAAVDELAASQERVRALEDELSRVRGGSAKDNKGKGRRRKS